MVEVEQNQIFKTWLRQYRGLLFKVVRAYVRSAMDQEDLFQEIIIQVWHSIPGFQEQSSIATWLYRIALNTAIKWITKERKQIEAVDTLDQVQAILQEADNPVDERLTWLYEEIYNLDEIGPVPLSIVTGWVQL